MSNKFVDLPEGMGDEVETPPDLFAAIDARWRIVWDAAATPSNILRGHPADCLTTDWRAFCRVDAQGVVFLNPPYSDPAPYLDAAAQFSNLGVPTVALLKADHSTSWWHNYVDSRTVIPLRSRVRFYYGGKPLRHVAAFPSVLVLFDGGLRIGKWR